MVSMLGIVVMVKGVCFMSRYLDPWGKMVDTRTRRHPSKQPGVGNCHLVSLSAAMQNNAYLNDSPAALRRNNASQVPEAVQKFEAPGNCQELGNGPQFNQIAVSVTS